MPSTARGPFLNSRTSASTSIPLSSEPGRARPLTRVSASSAAIKPPSRFSDPIEKVDVRCHRYLTYSTVEGIEYHRSQMSATPSHPVTAEPTAPAPKRPLSEALDISAYATGTAGEAWALLARLLFLHGKPRFPAIARELDLH